MPKTAPSSKPLCAVCELRESRYQCPRCSLRSCSLPCVKKHKVDKACDGQRSLTDFVPLSEYDENNMMSDYSFLENGARIADNAIRDNQRHGALQSRAAPQRHRLSSRQHCLLQGVKQHGTHLVFLPKGMSRPSTNRSSFNTRTQILQWTIEWRFPGCNDYHIVEHGVPDTHTVMETLLQHLQPDTPSTRSKPEHLHQLAPLARLPADQLHVYVMDPQRKDAHGQALLQAINTADTWAQALSGKTLYEFPTMVVSQTLLAAAEHGTPPSDIDTVQPRTAFQQSTDIELSVKEQPSVDIQMRSAIPETAAESLADHPLCDAT
ncbi:Box C/D snoRNA accumulation [Sorochytrium milnesiophthora]